MDQQSANYFDFNRIAFMEKRKGVSIKSITGQAAQLCLIKLSPGITTDHEHPEEQMGWIISGQALVSIGPEKRELGPGDGYYIPPHIRHSFEVLKDAEFIYYEVFCPPKTDNIMNL